MTVAVRADCPDCGPQILTPAAVRVHVSRVEGAGARYSFECRICQAWISRPAGYAVTRELLRAGAHADVVPREILEHPPSEVPALTEADVDAFLDRLESCEYPALNAKL